METADATPRSHRRPARTRIEVAARTRTGRRSVNADAFLIDEAAGLYAVADGMGDTPRSRIVAQAALDAVRELFLDPWAILPQAERSTDEAGERLVLGVAQAQGRIRAPGRAHRMGATFAGVVDCGEGIVVAHVGDSRVYLLRASKGRLAPVTRDHTVAGEACRRGVRPDDAARLPNAQALTQVIGANRIVDLRPVARRWEPGDIVLLCTDGVSDPLGAEALAAVLLDAPDLGTAAQRLVDHAVALDASDNATAVLVHRTT